MVAVGAVGSASARLWLRSEATGPVDVAYWPCGDERRKRSFHAAAAPAPGADGTCTIELPPPGTGPPLEPVTAYAFRLTAADGRPLGQGRFETAPADRADTPARFSFAFMSCHQPFDRRGRRAAHPEQMLSAALACLEAHDTKRVLTVGDQVYTDYPTNLSLFHAQHFRTVAPPGRGSVLDCSCDEIRAMLHTRYRLFWNVDGWRRLHAAYPCYPILDDHEIVDNWGSRPVHETPRWKNFARAARAAYFDYQAARIDDRTGAAPDFDYELAYGPVAVYVLDLRSNRNVGRDPRLFSVDQERRLHGFLRRHADADAIFIVLSVPPVHLPRLAARVARFVTVENEDFADRWSTAGHRHDRDRLLSHLHRHQREHPAQRVVILSGDIHIACAHEIAWRDGTPPLLQWISSGVTHRVGGLTRCVAELAIEANRSLELESGELTADIRLLPPGNGPNRNPYGDLNLGIIDFARRESGRYALRYSIYGHDAGLPVAVYRSRWV